MNTRVRTSALFAHIACWILFLGIVILFISNNHYNEIPYLLTTLSFWLFACSYILTFYINMYVLFPFVAEKNKTILYAALCIIIIGIFYLVQPFNRMMQALHESHPNPQSDNLTRALGGPGNNSHPPPGGPPPGGPPHNPPPHDGPPGKAGEGRASVDIISIFLAVMVVVIGIAIDQARRVRATVLRAAKLESDKLSANLSLLKAQINPHFLFNTLNSIYSLVVTKDDKAADAIVELSSMMRYIVTDSSAKQVSVDKEIEFIDSYVNLQKLRTGQTTRIEYTVNRQLSHSNIYPLILISFIENAFKYGVNPDKEGAVMIQINLDENSIRLHVSNHKVTFPDAMASTGIGLVNAKERLELAYPGKHQLAIEDHENHFVVNLRIELE